MTGRNKNRINQQENMNDKTATVIGATGLIGGHIVRLPAFNINRNLPVLA